MDTSNPFVPQDVPRADESLLVIHVNERGRLPADFDDLLASIPGAFRTRKDTLVVPGEHMAQAMEEVLAPALERLAAARRR